MTALSISGRASLASLPVLPAQPPSCFGPTRVGHFFEFFLESENNNNTYNTASCPIFSSQPIVYLLTTFLHLLINLRTGLSWLLLLLEKLSCRAHPQRMQHSHTHTQILEYRNSHQNTRGKLHEKQFRNAYDRYQSVAIGKKE